MTALMMVVALAVVFAATASVTLALARRRR
jgi:hypothetical protein